MRFTYMIARVVLFTTLLFGRSITVSAQQPLLITKLTVVKKPGHSNGLAMATVGKRTGRIASHALQGWIVLGGNSAVLLLSPEKKDAPYRLRYYQADEGKGRLLGYVPFHQAELIELQMGSTVKDFTYTREQTKFDLFEIGASGNPDEPVNTNTRTVGLTTRRFAYNAVLNVRPRKSRWRPYITAGPAFQLIALADAPLKKPSGYFVLGLSNIGLIKAAFDFGNTPPLNGGGIYQLGLQYGAGFKYRVLPRLTMRVDYGETWSQTPRIIRDSYISYEPPGLDNSYATHVLDSINPAKYVQQRATAGFALTF